MMQEEKKLFSSLGLPPAVCRAVEKIGWTTPTDIQMKAIPAALEKRDIIALAETGSGKTGAFALPILAFLLNQPSRFFAVVLAPTRELAIQINEVFDALGSEIGLLTVCLVGGVSLVDQAVQLAKGPHIIICTPGRIIDHLQNTKGFSLKNVKVVVLDEADRLISMDFEKEIDQFFSVIPSQRNTYLFSATLTSKVEKLKKNFLVDPISVSVSQQFQTPKGLVQQYVFVPAKWKDCFLIHLLQQYAGQMCIVFVSTCLNSLRISLMLKYLGFNSVCLHGQMSQVKRINAMNRFKSGSENILVATDLASRGLDIPNVDAVINYDIPLHGKVYIHRVGRTARNGNCGRSLTFVTQYDIEALQQLEALLGFKLPEHPVDESSALLLLERVTVAQRESANESKEFFDGSKGKKKVQDRLRHSTEGGNDNAPKKSKKRKLAQIEEN